MPPAAPPREPPDARPTDPSEPPEIARAPSSGASPTTTSDAPAATVTPVIIVGAGPGDPGLITVRGRAALAGAEVVVADRLVAPSLLRWAAAGAEVIVRGEKRSDLPQAQINQLLVERARAGKRVVRLKGGDPFTFGRGGEEAEALHAAGLPYRVVPGVTSGIAAPAYAGIPVTHRGLAGAVTFVTGHEADDKDDGLVRWDAMAASGGTLVLYMSVSHLPRVTERLVAGGRAPSTPVAVIERGTTSRQRTVVGTLADIVEKTRLAGVTPPALTVIGEVVELREALSWFESRPLHGRRVLHAFTSGEGPIDALDAAAPGNSLDLREVGEGSHVDDESGAELWAVRPLSAQFDLPSLHRPIAELSRYRWLAFTSRIAVDAFAAALREAGLDGRALGGVKIACLAGTAAALSDRLRLRADLIVAGGGTALGEALAATGATGPVLFPRARDGRPELADSLARAGIAVEIVDAYRTVVDDQEVARAVAAQREAPFAAIAFTSPRGAHALLDGGLRLDDSLVGAIGPTTAAALTARGVFVDVTASVPSHAVLLRELADAACRALAAPHQIG